MTSNSSMHESNKPSKDLSKQSSISGVNNTFQLQKKIMEDSFVKSLKSQKDLEIKQKTIEELGKVRRHFNLSGF